MISERKFHDHRRKTQENDNFLMKQSLFLNPNFILESTLIVIPHNVQLCKVSIQIQLKALPELSKWTINKITYHYDSAFQKHLILIFC